MSRQLYKCLQFLAFVFLPVLPILPCRGQVAQPSSLVARISNIQSSDPNPTAETYQEHWDALPLSENRLPAASPLLGEKDVLPNFTRELIQVQWRPHDPIDLYIIRPANVPKPAAVVFLYGYPTDTDRFRNDAYCESVVKHGFAAIGFVSALTGQRYHDRPMKEWFISQLPESLGASVHDVQMILNYVATRNDTDMNRVGIYGQGSGATIALLAASVDSRIKAVDLLDPWGDWPDWLAHSPQIPDEERSAYLNPDFLKSVAPFDPIKWLPQMNKRPFRLQQTLFSAQTPEAARDRIMKSVPPSATTLRYNTVTEYKDKASTDSKILDWLQIQLGSDSALPGNTSITK